jgi:hypothetical protein
MATKATSVSCARSKTNSTIPSPPPSRAHLSLCAGSTTTATRPEASSLGFEDLAARAGRIPGRGYVDETDAAWELLDEALEPFLAEMRRRATLGFIDASASIATGTIAGLRRLQDAPDGQLIAFAGDDAIDTLTETVLYLADNLRIELDERASQI